VKKEIFHIGPDELRAAAIPLALFAVCLVAVFFYHNSIEGSATEGRVEQGRYYLSFGHGSELETDASRFNQIAHREHMLDLWFAGLLATGIWSVYVASKARWRRAANP
jgi:hypothetical protein